MRSPKLQTLVLAVLVPALLAASTWMGWLTYRELYDIILEGFDQKLRATSSATAAFIEAQDHTALVRGGTEADPRYDRYVVPMQRIMDRASLTYLYTALLEADGSITYILDGTQGDEHSPLGSDDVLSQGEILRMAELRLSLREGSVFLSGLNPTEQWGILKTAFAPIEGTGDVRPAMAGADVNIAVVGTKARVAIAQVGLAALLSLLLGAGVSFSLARRLGAPLRTVRDGALRVAAGEFGHRIPSSEFVEMEALAETLNQMSQTIGQTLSDLGHQQESSEADRRTAGLLVALEGEDGDGAELPPWMEVQPPPTVDPSGFAISPERGAIVWIGRRDHPMEALCLRAELSTFVAHLGEEGGWDELVGLTAPLLRREIRVLLQVDATGTRVRCHALESLPVFVGGGNDPGSWVDLATHPELTLKPGERVRIASEDLGADPASMSAPPGNDLESEEAASDGFIVWIGPPEAEG